MVTIVSAYYSIKSKFSHQQYLEWLSIYFNALKHIPKVFICDETTKNELITKFNPQNTMFHCINFNVLPILKEYPLETWQHYLKLDGHYYHTAELGVIWASKKDFVNIARTLLPNEDWFCWIDAGCIRTTNWTSYTDMLFTRIDYKNLDPGVYLQQLSPIEENTFFKEFPFVSIAGGIILFHKDFIKKFIDDYNTTLKIYVENYKSISSDQYIMVSTLIRLKDSYIKHIQYNSSDFSVPDKWWFFLSYL